MQKNQLNSGAMGRVALLIALFLMLTIGLLGLSPAVLAQDAPASDEPMIEEPVENEEELEQALPPVGLSGRWIVEVAFKDNKILARRVNQVLVDGVVVRERTQRLRCRTKGAVTLGVDSADFAGGYVVCNFPSFRRAFNRMTPPGTPLLTQYTTVPTEEVDVWVQLEASNIDLAASATQPIVAHPEYQIAYTLDDVGGAEATLSAGTWSHTGPTLALTGTADRLGSRVNECSVADQECRMRHRLNGTLVYDNMVNPVPPWTVFNDQSVIYIGRDDAGTDRFVGEMSWLRYDPGVFVRTG